MYILTAKARAKLRVNDPSEDILKISSGRGSIQGIDNGIAATYVRNDIGRMSVTHESCNQYL